MSEPHLVLSAVHRHYGEGEKLVRVLESVQWNKKQAAGVLEISRGTLYRKIMEYGLEGEAKASSRNRARKPV